MYSKIHSTINTATIKALGGLCNAKEALTEKFSENKDGFDGLIVTIGLILLVMVLILVFKDTIVAQIKSSISSVSQQISGLSTWNSNP